MPASSVLMVAPVGFREDVECRSDNAFQEPTEDGSQDVSPWALREFNACVATLRTAGVLVHRFEGSSSSPSAVFPNNWFSTHEDGTLVLYPLRASSRRLERRPDIVDWLLARYPNLLDLTYLEDRGQFLEGTGSMVLDRVHRVAYAAESPRTDPVAFRNWCADMGYEPVLFQTAGPGGLPIYHTNVLLTLCDRVAVLCTECLLNPSPVLSSLLSTGHEVVEITISQMASFCGNCLELRGSDGRSLLALSEAARSAFRREQLELIQGFAWPIASNIPTIERYGGGSVRCMIAELAD